MPLVALHDREAVAVRRRAGLRVGIVSVAVSVLRLGEPAEVVEEMPDGVGGWNKVGVEDHHVLGAWVHPPERFLQRTALEALAARAVDDADARMFLPLLQLLDGLVGGVIGDDDLVVLVVERRARLEQPVDDAALVVKSEVNRDEGLTVGGEPDLAHLFPWVVDHDCAGLAELLTAQSSVALFVLAVGVSVAIRLAVGLQTVPVRVAVGLTVAVVPLELRRITEQRDENDAGDGHVVLEGIQEEKESAEECEQREREARCESVAEQETEPADSRRDDQAEHDACVDLAQKVASPDDIAAPAAVPDAVERVFDVVCGRCDAREAKSRLAFGLGKRGFIKWVGHRDDTMTAVGRGAADPQATRDVEAPRTARRRLHGAE